MSKDYKKIFAIVLAGFSLFFLAIFQISVINHFLWKFNVFLFLILFLILIENIRGAIFTAWLGGLLIDTAHFYVFGISSLILLSLAIFLIIFQKKVLLTMKTENILILIALTVMLYHFLEWALNGIFSGAWEKSIFYFLNSAIAAEFLLLAGLLLIVFKFKIGRNV